MIVSVYIDHIVVNEMAGMGSRYSITYVYFSFDPTLGL
jgi:hypothetical protein